jgi:hypothetical protein
MNLPTAELRKAVTDLFENPPGPAMKSFMQSPWVQMIVYEPCPEATAAARQALADEWKSRHNPKLAEDGQYPGYYEQ